MLSQQKQALAALIDAAAASLIAEQQAAGLVDPAASPRFDAMASLARPKQASHGDLAINLALQLAKPLKLNPRQVAERLSDHLRQADGGALIASLEIAGPGFINLRLADSAKRIVISQVLAAGDGYGRSDFGQGRPVLVEFVSANPTGPLHVGHGRQGALGDALAALLDASGWKVQREFYYNDAGAQINNLALSVQARARGLTPDSADFPTDGYRGDYIREIASQFMAGATVSAERVPPVTASGDFNDTEAVRHFAVAYLRREQDLDLQAFGIRFDNYFLESSLYADGKVQATVDALIAAGKTFEEGGALWLRSTDYGDDKDRVMRKSEGGYTYFVPDVAYHVGKWQRGFQRAINVQGSDHHGTIARVRAGLQALGIGIPKGFPDYLLHKMVTVMKGGEEVKISKRAGSYVTLRDLIDWSGDGDLQRGRDAVRFFLISRKPDTEFVFDVDLALSRTDENPVYYVQYAHARICSVFGQWAERFGATDGLVVAVESAAAAAVGAGQGSAEQAAAAAGRNALAERLAEVDLSELSSPREFALMAMLAEFPELLANAADEMSPHSIVFYLKDLAAEVHSYYNAERFLVDDPALRLARMALLAAARQVIRNGLALLGVSAPERM